MHPEVIPRLFDQFTQAESGTGRKYGGTGLGLNISKNLIEIQGGKIWVESQKGLGSRFYFQIRFEKAPSLVPVSDNSNILQNSEHLEGVKVLLAEDNEINQFFAKTILESYGCNVIVAANGLDCIEMYEKSDFDIILMDIQMPQMNGLEATQKIRKHPKERSKDIPILALTANALAGDKDVYLQQGMNDSLTKPFGEHELVDKMIALLGIKTKRSKTSEPEKQNAPQAKLYNLKQLEEVAKGNSAFIHKMIHIFLETSLETNEEIKHAYENQSWRQMSEAAHKYKSSIDTLNIQSIQQTIRNIENFDPAIGDFYQLETWISELEDTTLLVIEQMQRDFNNS